MKNPYFPSGLSTEQKEAKKKGYCIACSTEEAMALTRIFNSAKLQKAVKFDMCKHCLRLAEKIRPDIK